ncbi:hypothetical protein GCM10023187_11860 [Nibrella viscosa]|uniref:Lipoprotein n=2 Tax=Nibrella viscosa TaxID=1084524 RepID=A0ABP8K3C7_9BACT
MYALLLFTAAVSCKKEEAGPEPISLQLLTATVTPDDANAQCTKATDRGFENALTYTSNVDIRKYYAEISVDWVASNGVKGSFIAGTSKPTTADRIFQHSCFAFGTATWFEQRFTVRLYALSALGTKTGSVLAESNTIGPVRVEAPRPVVPTISISRVTPTLKKLNNPECFDGGSEYEYSIEYATNAPLDFYYVEITQDGNFSPSGSAFRFDQQARGVENSLVRVLGGSCTKFDADAAMNIYFTLKLYAKDNAGNKTGNPISTSNRYGPVVVGKPAGGARIGADGSAAGETGPSSVLPKW